MARQGRLLRPLLTGTGLILLLIFAFLFHKALNATPLLGLWDTGRYARGPLRAPPEMKAPPVDTQLVLTLDASDVHATPTLGALFDRYGLDNSLLRPTILASGMGAPDDSASLESLRNTRLSTPLQIKVPLQEPGK